MTEFIILSREDMLTLCDNKPVTCYIDKKRYVLCTEEYFEEKLSTAYCTAGKEKKTMLGTQEQRTEGIKKQAQEVIDLTYQIGYEAGYEEGKGQAWSEEIKKYEIEPDKAREYIKQGRKEAWEAADKLHRMHMAEIMEVFADDPLRETIDRKSLFRCCEPELAINKIREYEKKKQENDQVIRVGDEVYTEDKEIKFVVTGIGEESAHLVDCNGNFAWTKTYCLNKTGRHFHEIENVLGKLKEGV